MQCASTEAQPEFGGDFSSCFFMKRSKSVLLRVFRDLSIKTAAVHRFNAAIKIGTGCHVTVDIDMVSQQCALL